MSFRGYFDRQDAKDLAADLDQQGYDVSINGSRAYSTLGWFDDPLLNTMMTHGEASMVGVIFHELAHQQLYIKDDTAFNEAFASAVEQEGVRRWFMQKGQPEQYDAYLLRQQRRNEFYALLIDTREQLNTIYTTMSTAEEKRRAKQEIFVQLQQRYQKWKQQHNGYEGFDAYMSRDLNNANLALIATYRELVPNFLALLKSVDGDMERFYQAARKFEEINKEDRHRMLKQFL
jgi:predicted aminopeptidase